MNRTLGKRAAGSASRPQSDGGHTVRSPSTESATFHGTTRKGDYYVCERTRVIEFCMRQTQERR